MLFPATACSHIKTACTACNGTGGGDGVIRRLGRGNHFNHQWIFSDLYQLLACTSPRRKRDVSAHSGQIAYSASVTLYSVHCHQNASSGGGTAQKICTVAVLLWKAQFRFQGVCGLSPRLGAGWLNLLLKRRAQRSQSLTKRRAQRSQE